MMALEFSIDVKRNPRPVDLQAFASAFAPFAQVKFLLLMHRPFVNTVVSSTQPLMEARLPMPKSFVAIYSIYLLFYVVQVFCGCYYVWTNSKAIQRKMN
jgi:hypothetical protein